jgi:P4 family phage/plasmid primase-like protien
MAENDFPVDDDVFGNLVIPSVEEMDAHANRRPGEPPVKITPVRGKSAEIISPPPSEKQMTARYDEMGFDWERSPLYWNPTKKTRTGVGAKDGLKQNQGKGDPSLPAVLLHMTGLLGVDVDGDGPEEKRIDALCDASCVMKAKTRKGHHYVFLADYRVGSVNGTKASGLEIDTKTGKSAVLFVEPTYYIHPEEGRIEYKWERFPAKHEDLTPCPEEVVEWLCENGYSNPENRPRPTPRNVIVHSPATTETLSTGDPDDDLISHVSSFSAPIPQPPTTMEQVENLCSCLQPGWLAEFNNWLRLMYCLKNIDPSDEMRDLFLRHSARATGYKGYEAQNRKMWDGAKQSGRSGLGSLKHFAKKANPEKYFSDAKDTYWSLVNQENANGYCELFYNAMAGDLLYSQSQKCFYVYDERETLWKASQGNSYIHFLFVEICSSVFRKMLADIPAALDEKAAEDRKAKMKKIGGALKMCGGSQVIMMVSSFLPAFCRGDDDPATYFNQNPDLLPLANGVWKFSEKKLINYDRDHYFTFKNSIPYNPKADTRLMARACSDWFKGNKPVCEFIQMWLGYCLTGYTTRQDFFIAWGNKAGNGKSLLWGTILSLLLGEEKGFYRTITSDALSSERVGNNDQLYDLNGSRFAFLSEPRRAKGTQIDNEILKTLTGDKSFTVEAKYKNALTFRLMCKFAMACNDMPDLKFEDEGTLRRILIGEQNVCFLDPEKYELASEEDKASGAVKRKDDSFIKALLENVEGIMKWALEGANMYIDDPRKAPPPELTKAKAKAMGEADVLGNWIKASIRNFTAIEPSKRPSGWERKNLKFKTVKDILRSEHLNFGQNQAGFNKRLKEKLESLGFEVGGREDKGDQYIRYAEETPDEVEHVE